MDLIGQLRSWLDYQGRTQREKLEQLREQWADKLAALPQAELALALRSIRKAINSKKLKAARDALIGELRGDGLGGEAPVAVPEPAPADVPAAPAVDAPPDGERPGRNAKLEAAICADPEARESYLVYGDWLESQGDPHGQLIAIQHELNKSPDDKRMRRAEEELLAQHGARLLGGLADCDDMLTDVRWYMGFIRACRLATNYERFNGERIPDVPVAETLEWLLDDPGPGRFLMHLTVGIVQIDGNSYQRVCEVIGARPRPTMRSLYLGDFTYEETELNWSTIGDASSLYAGLPNLQQLTLRSGAMTLGEIDLPELRSFTTITGGLDGDAARSIADASWPRLERLSMQFGRPSYGATADFSLVAPILSGARLPRLRHLGLTNCEFTDEVCAALPGSELLPRLQELDLCMGTMSDAGAAAIADNADAFRHLALLDVSDNYLSDDARARLEGIAQNLVFGDQEDDGGDPDDRYASAVE